MDELKRRPDPSAPAGIRLAHVLRDVALVLLLAWGAAANFLAFHGYDYEDAYITFRYAANLAAGEGFVFNPGERVLGTSTPFYTLLLAAVAAFGLDVVTAAGVLYALGLSLCGWLGARLLVRAGYPNGGALFALAAVWGSGGVLHFFGMETALYLSLVFLAFLLGLRRPATVGAAWTTGLVLGLVATTRYDGVVVAGVVLAWRWIHSPGRAEDRSWLRRLPWREAAACGAVLGAWLLFAELYFGSALPTALGAKSDIETFSGYLRSSLRVQHAFLWSPLGRFWEGRPVPPLATLLLALPAVLRARRLMPRLWPLVAVAALLWLGYASIGPPTIHNWHLVPAVYCLLALGLAGWSDLLGGLRSARWAPAAVLALVLASAVALPSAARRELLFLTRSAVYRCRVPAYDSMISFLRDHGLDRGTVLTSEPGYLTYHTRQRAVDLVGLVTPDVGPQDGDPLARRLARHRPELIVLDSELGRLEWVLRESYLRLLQTQPLKLLLIRRNAYERSFDRLFERWLDGSYHAPPPAAHPPIPVDFESNPTPGWNHSLYNRFFVGRPLRDLRFDGRKVEDRYLHTFGGDPGKVGTLWSDPFRVDFDELAFRFAATGRRRTVAQLYVAGLPVAEVRGAAGEPPVEMRRVVLPVYPWRGRVAVLRFVDADRQGGFLVADAVTSRRYGRSAVVDDFESGVYGELWEQGFGDAPTPTRELARRYGLQVAQGRYAAASLLRPGVQALVSRPFSIDGDTLCFTVLDFGGPETSVNLWVGGSKVLRVVGRATGLPVPIRWNVAPWRGREAILRVVDRGDDPQRGIGIDSILVAEGLRP